MFPDNFWLIILGRPKNKILKSLEEPNEQETCVNFFRILKLKGEYSVIAPGPMSIEALLLLGI